MTPDLLLQVRQDPTVLFQGFLRVKDLVTQQPIRAKVKPLQRRGFEHYKQCQRDGVPCRQIWVKGRRAGGSDGCSALIYIHGQNYVARLGQMGTNYRTSHNMLEKVKFFGEHDDFPGWTSKRKVKIEKRKFAPEEVFDSDELASIPWDQRAEKILESKITWPHGSSVELYTAENPESARSAGLQGFHWTEFFRAPNGGAKDAGETLNAMIKTVPKRGFTFIGLEGTANGAQGAGYDLVRSARWPEEAAWWKKWETLWPQNVAKIGKELQFVIIFSAWFEDSENQLACTSEERAHLEETLTTREKLSISRYQCDGPKGPRLGEEVEATVWDQLKWRRATIEHECKQGGEEEFAQEFPEDILEAFRASGSPALDNDGLMAIEQEIRNLPPDLPHYGQIVQHANSVDWVPTARGEATIMRWEDPIPNCKYLLSCDPMVGADLIEGNGEKDRHSVPMFRDAYLDQHGQFHRVKEVARIIPPCQWEAEVLAEHIYLFSLYYGGATIVVEKNIGQAILKWLHEQPRANLYYRQEFDTARQKFTRHLGWHTSEATKRIAIAKLQAYVREQQLECLDAHALNEMRTLIVDSKGKVRASGSNHDDDCMALGIALACLGEAHIYTPASLPVVKRVAADERKWKGMFE